MTHDQAVAIIRGPREPGAEGYRRYAAACTEVYIAHMRRTKPGSFVTDAPHNPIDAAVSNIHATADRIVAILNNRRRRKMRTRDQDDPWSNGASGQGKTQGAQEAGVDDNGDELVMELPDGDLSAYYIGTSNGRAAVFRHAAANSTMDPGTTSDARAFIRQRDAAAAPAAAAKLRAMNETNRAYWKR